jgi:hypothetical protein
MDSIDRPHPATHHLVEAAVGSIISQGSDYGDLNLKALNNDDPG